MNARTTVCTTTMPNMLPRYFFVCTLDILEDRRVDEDGLLRLLTLSVCFVVGLESMATSKKQARRAKIDENEKSSGDLLAANSHLQVYSDGVNGLILGATQAD